MTNTAPAWYLKRTTDAGQVYWSPYKVLCSSGIHAAFELPAYQRPVVWSREKQLAFVRAVWAGLPTAPVFIWHWQEHQYVMDGQQRLTALGAHLARAGGKRNEPPRFNLDYETGTWSDGGPGPAMTLFELASRRLKDIQGWAPGEVECWAVCTRLCFNLFILECPPDLALESFRALAQPGVPWDVAEIERMIASVHETGVARAGIEPATSGV